MLTTEKQNHLQVGQLSYLPQPEVNTEPTLAQFGKPAFLKLQKQLFNGDTINCSEQRPAWHTACREPQPIEMVRAYQDKMQHISEQIRHAKFNNLSVTNIVNIGIGGSDLGPKLICEAFADSIDGPTPHFVSNLDNHQLDALLATLNPASTLFIVASKSFKTLETLENMKLAQNWLQQHDQNPADHIIAISSNAKAAMEHGIRAQHILLLPEWVGGRFSVWSTIGLIIATSFGMKAFKALLAGAHTMDQHFQHAKLCDNIPLNYASVVSSLMQQRDIKSIAILPYAHKLRSLTEYLQQLFMESLGKSTNTAGQAIDHATGPLIFGGPGTNCQHSFQQLMMQGSHSLMADFILPLQVADEQKSAQTLLAANCITQVKTLRDGHHDSTNPQKNIAGGQAANLFVLEQLSFESIGTLLAMYEHVVFSLGYLFDINPFDQWGVEYAKSASQQLHQQLKGQPLSVNSLRKLL